MKIKSKEYEGKLFSIGGVIGLCADRTQGGIKYLLRWRPQGNRKKQFCKYYPRGTTLKRVRELAKIDRELVDQGLDPREYRKEQEEKQLAEKRAQELAKLHTFKNVVQFRENACLIEFCNARHEEKFKGSIVGFNRCIEIR